MSVSPIFGVWPNQAVRRSLDQQAGCPCPSNGKLPMTVAAADLPPYLTRIFMDFQGEPDDQKRAASEAAKISQDDRLLLKTALEDYGHKVHPLSRLARLIRAGRTALEREGQWERRRTNQRSRPERPDRKGPERERPAAGEEAEDRASQVGRRGVELPRSAGGGPATRTSRRAAIGTRRAGPGTTRPAQSPHASRLRHPGIRQASDRVQQAAGRQTGPNGTRPGGGPH